MSINVYKFNKSKLFWIIFLLLITLYSFWILMLRVLPFIDLPFHLASAAIYRYYDNTPDFSHFFNVELFPKPNVFHLLFLKIPLFPSIEIANKVYYILYIILLPLSMLLIIRKLKGDHWFALLSFLLIYNYNLKWGLVGFTFSVPVILFLIYFMIDHFEKPTTKSRILISLFLFFLFFVHVISALFALLLFSSASLIYHRGSLKKLVLEFFLTTPLIFMMFLWWNSKEKVNQSIISFLFDYYKTDYFSSFVRRAALIFYDNYFLYGGILGYMIGTIFSLFIIIPFLVLFIRNIQKIKDDIRGKRSLPFTFLFCSLGCAFLLPDGISYLSYWPLYHRFSVFILLSMIILGSIYSTKKSSLIKVLILVAICMVHVMLWSDYFLDFQAENRDFTPELFPEGGKGKVLAGMIFDYKFRDMYMYNHFDDYFIVWKHGISTSAIVSYKFNPVRRMVSEEFLPGNFDPKYDKYDGKFSNVDYILVRGKIPRDISLQLKEFNPLKSRGKWTLYRKNHSSY